SGVHAILLASCLAACAPRRSESLLGQGRCSTGDPNCRLIRVDVSGTSQVPRRSILCLCPALRPRPNRRSLASLTVSSMLPPHFPRRRLQRLMNFGALSRGFGTCCLRFTNGVATIHAKLASGWLAHLYREGVEPSGSLQKVSDHPSSFSGLCLAQGKFHFEPPFTSLDHLVRAREQRRRHFEAERPGSLQVDHELELGRLQDREVCWFFALKDAAGIDADLTIHVQNIDSVTHQLAHFDIFSDAIHGRNRVTRRQRDYLLASARKERT